MFSSRQSFCVSIKFNRSNRSDSHPCQPKNSQEKRKFGLSNGCNLLNALVALCPQTLTAHNWVQKQWCNTIIIKMTKAFFCTSKCFWVDCCIIIVRELHCACGTKKMKNSWFNKTDFGTRWAGGSNRKTHEMSKTPTQHYSNVSNMLLCLRVEDNMQMPSH